ncbi:hypothetical protein [Paenibacillus alvei]|uniref:hypothetical protein n=1 Tax=Paenibacillus alvei TaxID=44250 RepID=UPI0018CE3A0A|nr:hypothetical protein [Paenibacillus alvei]MBG9734952.1 hypothetical protein [Paenibacillus alvei]MBG9744827.1 hypothetical protein [Paenibacillus alvei]MCY9578728.1 hypothetical protein [Paenibacillus alvei]MCY9583786.1 hypothetical protein [Paenibacillus alvei]
MIKIDRVPPPPELTDEKKKELTEKFINEKGSVWATPYIKDTLFNMSNGKCSFCECKLGEEGKYMHVEHFHHKDSYPNEVVEWNNLLPCCVRCNTNKGIHDTVTEPIIDVTICDPRDHLLIDNYRYKSKNNSQLGRTTIEVIYLNDSDKLVRPRFDIANKAKETLESILDKARDYKEGVSISTRRKNQIVNGLKSLLREAHPDSQYSAIVATAIMHDIDYLELKDILISFNLWDLELQEIESDVVNTSLYS